MSSTDTFRLVEAVQSIKTSKRHGLSPSVLAQQLKLPGSDDAEDNLQGLRKLDPVLARSLEQSSAIRFEEDTGRFYFNFAQQFKSAYDFDVALKERSPIIIDDPDISYEGLMEYIEVRVIAFVFCALVSVF
jgi:hypothetical protein